MGETMALLLCLVVAVLALYGFIPWATRCGSLYLLHNLRDRVYNVGDQLPAARRSLIYRDVEFLVTFAIHAVRDRTYWEAVSYMGQMLMFSRPHATAELPDGHTGRLGQYRRDRATIFAATGGDEALDELREVSKNIAGAMMLRTTFGHPVVTLALLTAILAKATFSLFDKATFSLFDKINPREPEQEPTRSPQAAAVPSSEVQLSETVTSDWADPAQTTAIQAVKTTLRNLNELKVQFGVKRHEITQSLGPPLAPT